MAQPNYRQLARQKAMKYGLDPSVFERQIQAESSFNPNAVSPAGAIGIAQIMPGTAKGWGVDPHDPEAALDAAARNMASYVKKYGSYKNALVAYNAGPGRVGKSLLPETANYVQTILGGKNPKVGRAVRSATPGGTSYPSTANPSPDIRKQLALSLLGMGGGGGYDSLDPLSLVTSLSQQTQSAPALKKPAQNLNTPTGSNAPGMFDGKRVASWIIPILKKARATGYWKGGVNSGIRSKSEQLAAAKRYGLQHYPNGPLASNHVEGNPGAVDVSDPEGLKQALKAIHNNRLKSSMPEDKVHFSGTGY